MRQAVTRQTAMIEIGVSESDWTQIFTNTCNMYNYGYTHAHATSDNAVGARARDYVALCFVETAVLNAFSDDLCASFGFLATVLLLYCFTTLLPSRYYYCTTSPGLTVKERV